MSESDDKPDTPKQELPPWIARPFGSQRHQAPPGECAYCDRMRAERTTFHPPHDASSNCQSGRRNHCSCDTCF